MNSFKFNKYRSLGLSILLAKREISSIMNRKAKNANLWY